MTFYQDKRNAIAFIEDELNKGEVVISELSEKIVRMYGMSFNFPEKYLKIKQKNGSVIIDGNFATRKI